MKFIFIILTAVIMYFFYIIYSYIADNFHVPSSDVIQSEFNDADKFIKYGYPEIKALSFQFLTLISAILIFSLTFSEKIINYVQANTLIKTILITGWTLLLMAIISDGIGVAYNAYAVPIALVDIMNKENNLSNIPHFYEPAFISLRAILMSGIFFIGGVFCIVLSGVLSITIQSKINPTK